MKKQFNQFKIILAISGIIILYIILFPVSLTREVVMEPVWYKELSPYEPPEPAAVQGPVVPFRVDNLFGFADLKGHLQYLGQVNFDVTQNDKLFINYKELPESLALQNTKGDVLANLKASGYPLLHPDGDKLFIVTRDSMGIEQLNQQGRVMWSAEFASLITSLSLAKDNVLIGLVNGKLKLFDNQGSLVYDVKLEKSQMPVILGCAVSADGMKLAGISGLHPQNFFFVQREKFNNTQLIQQELKTAFRREALVKFSKSGNYCFFEQEDGLGVYDAAEKKIRYFTPDLATAGGKPPASQGQAGETGPVQMTGLEELGKTGHFCLLLEKEKQTHIFLMQPVNLLYYHEAIPYEHVFLQASDNHILLGFTNTDNSANHDNPAEENSNEETAQTAKNSHTYLMQFDFSLM